MAAADLPATQAGPGALPERYRGDIQALGFDFLRWPDDFEGGLSPRALQASLGDGDFDGILLREKATVEDLAEIWAAKALHILPIIDLTGALGEQADMDCSKLNFQEADQVEELIQRFHYRRGQIHRDLLLSDDLGDKLLNRAFVSGEEITATYNANVPEQVSYNLTLDSSHVINETAKLFQNEFLERSFFDRFHICDRCSSSRFNVREECVECRSPDISEEPYLHHFRCAYQGPESDFQQGNQLICPKCRYEVSKFSIDYDKPGSIMKCGACGHASSEPNVGLLCIDCQAHYDGDTAKTRDIFSYRISERGLAYLEAGRMLLGPKRKLMRFAELPIQLIVALNSELKRYEEEDASFALIDISYQNERQVVHDQGPRQFEKARDLFLETLSTILRKEDKVVRGQKYDFALLPNTVPEDVREDLVSMRTQAAEHLRDDLGIVMHVYGPEEFA